ncbi:MAG: hypothetical protein WAV05_09180 [Anaerolineales bacterium]
MGERRSPLQNNRGKIGILKKGKAGDGYTGHIHSTASPHEVLGKRLEGGMKLKGEAGDGYNG